MEHTLITKIRTRLLVLVLVALGIQTYAQDLAVTKLSDELSQLQDSNDNMKRNQVNRLSSLVNDLQPAIYLEKGSMNNTTVADASTSPLMIFTDASSLDLLYEANEMFKSVQFIRINIDKASDLKSILNLSKLNSFPNLRYIHFQASIELCSSGHGYQNSTCEADRIATMLRDVTPEQNGKLQIKVLYSVTASN